MNESRLPLREPDFTDLVCPECGNDGWYIDHADECYENGDCNCSVVQRRCKCRFGEALGA